MRIVVIGGSAGGLFSSLLLARAGHEVVVIEQDDLRAAPDVDGAAAVAHRPSAPQIVQPHMAMAQCRELLRTELPDVYAGLLAAGVEDAPLSTKMPPTLADRSPRPGDEQLAGLMTRRSTIDWVLRRAAEAQPGVTFRYGERVLGLTARPSRPPHVTGVRTATATIRADVTVDASGRRSPIDRWLDAVGASPAATWFAECGLAYYGRHYRIRGDAALPGPPTSRWLATLDDRTVGIWGADNGTVQLAVAPLASDRRFRGLTDAARFTAVARSVPLGAAWLDGLDPITEVFPMAGIHNTLRRLVVAGRPVVTGLHAVGDSVCTTNPTFGRGLSLALTNAVDLRDTLTAFADDPAGQAVRMDDLVGEHVAPFYDDQAKVDAARLAHLRHHVDGTPLPPRPAAADHRVDFPTLRAASTVDPTAFRGFWALMGMVRRPEEIYTDPDIVAACRAATEPVAAGASR